VNVAGGGGAGGGASGVGAGVGVWISVYVCMTIIRLGVSMSYTPRTSLRGVAHDLPERR
jgi:hypothetical protein